MGYFLSFLISLFGGFQGPSQAQLTTPTQHLEAAPTVHQRPADEIQKGNYHGNYGSQTIIILDDTHFTRPR